MPSIIDAFEESLQDNHTLSKCVIFAIPIYYCIDLYSKENPLFYGMSAITFILLFGFLIKCTTNVRNGKDYVLPSFNIFSIIWAGIKGLIAIGPLLAILSMAAVFVCKFLEGFFPNPDSMVIWKYIVWGLFGSFMMTGYLSYAKTFKISDAYNFKAMADSCVDVFAGVFFMIPQIIIVDALIIAPVTYLIWIFFGIPHPIAIFFWSMCLVFTLSITGHYLAQVDYETIKRKDDEDKNSLI